MVHKSTHVFVCGRLCGFVWRDIVKLSRISLFNYCFRHLQLRCICRWMQRLFRFLLRLLDVQQRKLCQCLRSGFQLRHQLLLGSNSFHGVSNVLSDRLSNHEAFMVPNVATFDAADIEPYNSNITTLASTNRWTIKTTVFPTNWSTCVASNDATYETTVLPTEFSAIPTANSRAIDPILLSALSAAK